MTDAFIIKMLDHVTIYPAGCGRSCKFCDVHQKALREVRVVEAAVEFMPTGGSVSMDGSEGMDFNYPTSEQTMNTREGESMSDKDNAAEKVGHMQSFYEKEKQLRLELDDCNSPFCLDVPGCVCPPEEKASIKAKSRE